MHQQISLGSLEFLLETTTEFHSLFMIFMMTEFLETLLLSGLD